jgi:hypothetical protein
MILSVCNPFGQAMSNLIVNIQKMALRQAVGLGLSTGYYVGNFFGYSGIIIFAAGFFEHFQSGAWVGKEFINLIPTVSAILAIFGTVWTCIGVLAPPNPRPVSTRTKRIAIPVILLMCIGTIIFWNYHSTRPNDLILTGLTLIGLGAAVLRLLSHEERW